MTSLTSCSYWAPVLIPAMCSAATASRSTSGAAGEAAAPAGTGCEGGPPGRTGSIRSRLALPSGRDVLEIVSEGEACPDGTGLAAGLRLEGDGVGRARCARHGDDALPLGRSGHVQRPDRAAGPILVILAAAGNRVLNPGVLAAQVADGLGGG